MLQVAQDDPDATNPEFNLIRPAVVDCNVCNGPDRDSWGAPETDNTPLLRPNPRPRPGGGLANFGEAFSEVGENIAETLTNIFRPGNNNNNNNNDADDDDNQDQGARPPPAAARPQIAGCWPLCKVLGRT